MNVAFWLRMLENYFRGRRRNIDSPARPAAQQRFHFPTRRFHCCSDHAVAGLFQHPIPELENSLNPFPYPCDSRVIQADSRMRGIKV